MKNNYMMTTKIVKMVFDFYSGRRREIQKKLVRLSKKDKQLFRIALKNDDIFINLLINNR